MFARIAITLIATLAVAVPAAARAHCDTLDGPVVRSGRTALESGDPAHALVWVQPRDDREIWDAYRQARQARGAGPAASAAAEHRFLETLVRVHRRGEGAPFTGLKPGGQGVGAAVRAADEALHVGSAKGVQDQLAGAMRAGVEQRFAPVSRPMPVDDVAAGRAWVAAYVEYVHYVEAVENAARGHGAAHERDASAASDAVHPHAH